MTTLIEYTAEDLRRLLAEQWVDEDDGEEMLAGNIRSINTWLERGDGAAVYENHDLSHPAMGHKIFLSYGSSAAQIESDDPAALPQFCPINLPHGLMHWRYVLVGTYRGESL